MNIDRQILSKEEINNRFLTAVQELLRNRIVSSKSTLADAFGIKPAKFSEILNGRMKAGVDMLAILCDYYCISPDWLLMSRGNNVFRESEELPPVILYEGDGCIPPFIQKAKEDKSESEQTNNIQADNNSLIAPFMQLIKEKDRTIMEQAEEIGQLRERIAQMQQRFEKDAANANTDTIASVG